MLNGKMSGAKAKTLRKSREIEMLQCCRCTKLLAATSLVLCNATATEAMFIHCTCWPPLPASSLLMDVGWCVLVSKSWPAALVCLLLLAFATMRLTAPMSMAMPPLLHPHFVLWCFVYAQISFKCINFAVS